MTRKPEPPLVHNIQTIDPELANDPTYTIPLSSFPNVFTAPSLSFNKPLNAYANYLPNQLSNFFDQPNQQPNYCLYLWHTTDDLLPFYVGIGTIHSCTSRHKYPNNQITIHQMYRDLCGPTFLCTIILNHLSPTHAQSYQHYTYTHFSSLSHPGCYTQLLPSTPFTNYNIITPYFPIPLPPESELVRWGRKHQLQAKIVKWITNQQYQRRKLNNPTLPMTIPPTPPAP